MNLRRLLFCPLVLLSFVMASEADWLVNPDFELGTSDVPHPQSPTNWTESFGLWARAVTNNQVFEGKIAPLAHNGNWMASLSPNFSDRFSYYSGVAQMITGVPAGATCVFSGYYLIQNDLPASHWTTLEIEFYGGSSGGVFGPQLRTTQTNWTYFAVTNIAPSGVVAMKVYPYYADQDGVTNSYSDGFNVFWDSMSVSVETVPEPKTLTLLALSSLILLPAVLRLARNRA